jgi:hypothetical protein
VHLHPSISACCGLTDEALRPKRKIAVQAGFRGARYISAEASARGQWLSLGGSKLPGGDGYATTKQGPLATALAFAREYPRLRF